LGAVIEGKRVEDALRIRDSAIASSINAIAIADLESNLTYVNRSFLRLWGYDSDEEVLGKHSVEFWQSEEKALEALEASRDGGSWMGELVARRKDGSSFDVQLSASVVIDEVGRPICVMTSCVDITERKRAEDALKRRNRELATLYEAATAISSNLSLSVVIQTVADQMTQALDSSGCALSLWDRKRGLVETLVDYSVDWPDGAEPLGTTYDLNDYPATRSVLETRHPMVIQCGDPMADVTELAWMEKEKVQALLMLPLIARDQVLGLVELFDETEARDYTPEEIRLAQSLVAQAAIAIENARLYEQAQQEITERRRAEEALRERTAQLEAANKELEAFTYSVSHDLRAPLRSIDGFSLALLEDYADKLDEDGQDYLRRVRAASQRMAQLIEDLLKLSRLTRREMRRETVDLSALAQEIVAELEQREPECWRTCWAMPGSLPPGIRAPG
jgi:PAS domain S-box-containing protein